MGTLLDDLSEQARAQGLAKRSALFAVLVPVMLVLLALFVGDGEMNAYWVPIAIALLGGITIHLAFRWLERRGRRG